MPPTSGVVVYAVDPTRVAAFYERVAGLSRTVTARGHLVLESESFQLVVVRVPDGIAAGIELADPPVRREDTAVKPAFVVADLAGARAAAAATGGVLDPPEREWRWQGWRVCDGHDPEGNVLQLREEKA